jgi:hypothetical protein
MKKTMAIFAAMLYVFLTFESCGSDNQLKESESISNSKELAKQNKEIVQQSNEVDSFTVKKYEDLPSWFDQVERTYMLNDDRIIESDLVEYVGGYVPNKGEIFFINNSEVIFPENQITINEKGTEVTKTLTSGQYTIQMIWDKELSSGAYSEGKIIFYYNKVSVFNSPLIISGL